MESKQEASTWSHLEESLSMTDEKPIGLRLVLAVKGVQSKTLLLKDQSRTQIQCLQTECTTCCSLGVQKNNSSTC